MSGEAVPKVGSPEYEYQIRHYGDDERPQQYVGILICTIVPTLAVVIRVYAQRVYNKIWGLDDLFIIVALVCMIRPFG